MIEKPDFFMQFKITFVTLRQLKRELKKVHSQGGVISNNKEREQQENPQKVEVKGYEEKKIVREDRNKLSKQFELSKVEKDINKHQLEKLSKPTKFTISLKLER